MEINQFVSLQTVFAGYRGCSFGPFDYSRHGGTIDKVVIIVPNREVAVLLCLERTLYTNEILGHPF
jgi:hypothetical protein